MNIIVLTLKPDSFTTVARRWFLQLHNAVIEKTVPSLSLKPPGMGISFMLQGVILSAHGITCIKSYTHRLLLQLLSSHSSLCLTSHYPLWFHLSWSSTLCSLLKMLFSQPSPVSRPSSYSTFPFCTYSFLPVMFPSITVLSGSDDVALRLTIYCCHPWNLKGEHLASFYPRNPSLCCFKWLTDKVHQTAS